MKIICPKPNDFSPEILNFLKRNFICNFRKINQSEFNKNIKNYDVVLTRFNNFVPYIKNNKLKYILSPTTGVDHIHPKYFKSKTKIICLKDQFKFLDKINATSEFTIYLILKFLREVNLNKSGFSSEIYGKKIGIIGYGRVGKKVSRILKSFGSKILTYDINIKKVPTNKYSTVNNLLKNSDIIFVHIPLNNTNIKFFDAKKLNKIKKGTIIVNTSRGDIFDEKKLLIKIRKKKLYYATDVIGKYFKTILNKLSNEKRIIYTRHVAGLTEESVKSTDKYILNKFLNDIKYKK